MNLFIKDSKVTEKVIYIPELQMFNHWKQLMASFTVADLKVLAERLAPLIRKQEVTIDRNGSKLSVPEPVTKTLNGKGLTLKSEFVSFMAFFLADRRNFLLYFDTLSTGEKQIWETAVREYFINEEQINKLARTKWIEPSRYRWRIYDQDMSGHLKWFSYCCCKIGQPDKYGYYRKGLYFTVQKDIFNLVCPLFSLPPVTFLMDALPENHGLHTFCAEEDIFLECPLLESLYQSGTLNTGKPKVPFTTIKKILKRSRIKEFFPTAGNEVPGMLRSYLLVSCYILSRIIKRPEDSQTTEEMLQDLLSTTPRYPELLLPILLPHLTGLQKKAAEESNGRQLAAAVTSYLKTAEDKWVSVDLLCDTILSSPDHHTLCRMFSPAMFDKMELKNNKQEHVIFLDRVYQEVTVPYLKAFLFLMGALGGLELAYREPDADDPSYFDGLKYVRLSALGKYLLGLTRKYSRPLSKEEKSRFELSTDKLIIRVTDERYETLLSEIAVPVGNHRFHVSPESFLKNCKYKKEISHKITFFKEHISADLPANWEDFFNRLTGRLDSIKPVSDRYDIYRIDKEDKELQRFVSTDPVIRAHSLRAEGFLLLVAPADFKTIANRLKEAGYWMEERIGRM